MALPAAVAFLARSLGLGDGASGLAAVLSVLVSSPYGVGLRGLFETGLVPHQVGAVFFCLALGAAVRTTGDGRRRWVVLLAAAAGGPGRHPPDLPAGPGGHAGAGARRPGRAPPARPAPAWLRLAAGCAAGAGLCGFWLVPFLAHRDLQGIVTTWGPPPLLRRLGSIASGDVLLPAGFAVAVVAGWAYQLAGPAGDRAALVWAAPPALYLLVAHGLPHLVGTERGNAAAGQPGPRLRRPAG